MHPRELSECTFIQFVLLFYSPWYICHTWLDVKTDFSLFLQNQNTTKTVTVTSSPSFTSMLRRGRKRRKGTKKKKKKMKSRTMLILKMQEQVHYLLDASHFALDVLIVTSGLSDELLLLQHLFPQFLNQLRLVVDLLILITTQHATWASKCWPINTKAGMFNSTLVEIK